MRKYFAYSYPSTHWVQQVFSFQNQCDPKLIAIAFFKTNSSSNNLLVNGSSSDQLNNQNVKHGEASEYAIYLNPTDKRGYRCIVRLVKSSDMASTFNREYTKSEKVGLGILLQFMSDCYGKVMPISQISIAGNNSHQFNDQSGETILGREEEPSFLHGHVYGRGNPEECYLADVKLDGPVPGVLFDMMGKSKEKGKLQNHIHYLHQYYKTGNDGHVLWMDGEMEKVSSKLMKIVEEMKVDYEEYGLKIITN